MLANCHENNLALERFVNHVRSPRLAAIQRIQSTALQAMQNHMVGAGFVQLMPLLLSPITDPLNHGVYPAELIYEARKMKLTASMIFHKQLSLMAPELNKIFIVSPNIRLEKTCVKSSSNHLIEFSQFDFEWRDATMDDAMGTVEDLLLAAFSAVAERNGADLALLGRALPRLVRPFPRFSTADRGERSVDDYCEHLSITSDGPVFVTNFKREFYDREEPPGTYRNFDLLYPEGFGEALSGAEREYQYADIIRRMKELEMDQAPFRQYLAVAEGGGLPRSAGGGLGMQRLVKFLTGQRHISDVCLFDRSIASDFLF